MKTFTLILFFLISFITKPCFGQAPYMESCLINSCAGTCSEGNNEIIFLNTGASSVLVNSTNVNISYGTTSPPGTNYTDAGLVTNPATTAILNTAAGCAPNLLIEATNTTVPPNSIILVVQNGICASSLNWPGLCPMGPIYITYSNDVNWGSGGNFVNGTGAVNTRFFRTSITNTSATTTIIDYNYTLPGGFGTDGAFATWTDIGGPAASYGDNDCILTPTILPVSLLEFSLEVEENATVLNWKTEREENNAFFTIKKSNDGLNYSILNTIKANESGEASEYQMVDFSGKTGYTYYQLFQTDLNGHESYLDELVAFRVGNNRNQIYPNPTTGISVIDFETDKPELVKIKATNQFGQIVQEFEQEISSSKQQIEIDFSNLPAGIYLIETINLVESKRFTLLRL